MKKLLSLIGIIIVGCLMARLYGIILDQFTYTISPEYYTKFQFYQFEILDEGNETVFNFPRFQVSIVGFMETWWMGIPVAIIFGLFSLHSDIKFMIETASKAFIVPMVIAFLGALYGLYYGFTHLANQPKESFHRWFIPANLVDFKSSIAVGWMHNESYIGGLYGPLGGIAYIGWRKGTLQLKQKKSVDV